MSKERKTADYSESLRERALLLIGRTTYAVGHLDCRYYGYNDSAAIGSAVDAIDMILNNFNDIKYIECVDRDELLMWKDELKCAGRNDAYTAAIAQALNIIAEDILEVCKELGIE